MDFKYVCNDCGREYGSENIMYRCPACSGNTPVTGNDMQRGNLITLLDSSYLSSLKERNYVSPEDFFPYPVPDISSYPVGNTPLISPKRLIDELGYPGLMLKNDGANPSGSFKDRASQLVAAQAVHFGEKTIALVDVVP